ncbi:MAG: nucleotidyltransferase substrate binding protein [Dysgonamonadaceae bacterium]|jgi:nucleotidyltransferase substrate binding protein (TIGR01987 family)|nr:nucleotidyltransferase substrate binding protein [Dysgonamonadaceae bacterium]
MKNEDVRWQQRFQNFSRAYSQFQAAIRRDNLNELEQNGLIQRFEFTVELAWKVMKDFLEAKGFTFNPSPKDTFRQAQEAKYIDYAQELIDALNLRNELSHDYDGELFRTVEAELRNIIFPSIEKLYIFFKNEWNETH